MSSLNLINRDRLSAMRTRLNGLLEQKWLNIGLRAKMSALVVVGLIGLMAVFLLIGTSTARQSAHKVLNERMVVARLGALNLDASLEHNKNILKILANQPELRDVNASQGERRAALERFSALGQPIFFLNQAGQVVATASGDDSTYQPQAVSAVQAALAEKRFSVSLVTQVFPGAGQSPDLPQALIAVPVRDQQGRQLGSLATLTRLSSTQALSSGGEFDLGATGTIDIVDQNGLVLISNRPERVLSTHELDLVLQNFLSSAEPGVETCLGCYGSETEARDEVIAFAPLKNAPWGVVVRQKAEEVFAPVRRLTIILLILSLVTVVGALALVWVTTNSVIKPVQMLTEAAQRIAGGDLVTPISAQFGRRSRRDEIGALAQSFATMRRRLKHSMDEVQALNRDLDARVQERTQAAMQAQQEAQATRDDLRAIIDALSDELVVLDVAERTIQQVNQAVVDRYGPLETLIGSPIDAVLPCGDPDHGSNCECPIPAVVESGRSVRVTHEHQGRRPGEIRYIEIVASPMIDASGRITRVVELMRDISAEKKLKDSLIRRNQQLSILNSLALTINQSLDLEIILGKALDEMLRLIDIDIGAVFLREDNLGKLELAAFRGLSERAAQFAAQMGMLDGACGGIVEKGQIVLVPDFTQYRGKRAASLRREKLSSLAHVPLTVKGCTLGSMCVGTRRQHEFGSEEQELLTVIGSQIAAAIENARLYAEVQQKEQMRGKLFNKAITVQEDERKRIARELHDDTSQALAALMFAAEEAAEMDELEEIKSRMEAMRSLAQRTLDGVHKLIFDLRPTMLDHLGLVPALRWFAESRLRHQGVRVTVEEVSPPQRMPPEVETALFRVVQEAITNISRHAAARNVCIVFQFIDDSVIVTVEDDGIGFDVYDQTLDPDSGRGLGLLGMQERIELLGGEIEIDTAPGSGSQLHIKVPLPEVK
ncbi:MAG TPA: GAF domain-containing protein [Anaerolineales bacterium]|nr:GAF domain-containing protein [Anaerolineales bacterium]